MSIEMFLKTSRKSQLDVLKKRKETKKKKSLDTENRGKLETSKLKW